jgi:hypothetical protein
MSGLEGRRHQSDEGLKIFGLFIIVVEQESLVVLVVGCLSLSSRRLEVRKKVGSVDTVELLGRIVGMGVSRQSRSRPRYRL